jgi:parallel beta-helix repeat protein
VLPLAFNIQPVKAIGTIYIRADGSIDSLDAPISTFDNVTYTLIGDITGAADGIVVEKDEIVIDGAGYTLQGTGWFGNGINLIQRSNITIKNTRIRNFHYCIYLEQSSNNIISGNNIENSALGIGLYGSKTESNSVTGNNITNNDYGIYLQDSSNNSFSGNNITCAHATINEEKEGIVLTEPYLPISNNCIYGNVFVGCGLDASGYGNIVDDNLVNGKSLVYLEGASNLVVEDAGQVILLNCNNITIRNLNLSYTNLGLRLWQSNNSIIVDNNITANDIGVVLGNSNNNSFRGNNLDNLSNDISLYYSSGNKLYHNNLYSFNSVSSDNSANVWDDGYPSGGNYWSNYNGADANGDGIGDTPYVIYENNKDRYPLMNPCSPLPEHELVVSITAPVSLQFGGSSSLYAIVTNQGLNDEVNVVLSLFVNGTKTNSTTIPLLQPWNSSSLSYLWTPTVQGTYNVTAYATPVPRETSVENNHETEFIRVVQVVVKAGDWIKCTYTISGWPSGTPYPEWLKVEFLSVEGTNATVRVTMQMSDGTEQNATAPVDIAGGGGEAFGLSGFVVPANLTVGDVVYISGYGNVTIAGETTGSYAGASRTVVYAGFSQYGTGLIYHWDKQTGVMVEASTTSGTMTGTGKATETNMWQPAPGFPIDPLFIAIAVVIVAIAAFLFMRRRKASTENTTPETNVHE